MSKYNTRPRGETRKLILGYCDTFTTTQELVKLTGNDQNTVKYHCRKLLEEKKIKKILNLFDMREVGYVKR